MHGSPCCSGIVREVGCCQVSENVRQLSPAGGLTLENTDRQELENFESLAHSWWDPDGDHQALHDINPVRAGWIAKRTSLKDAEVLDVGCGGGLLSEALACKGARVTGIDAGETAIEVARLHCLESGLSIDYRHTTAEQLVEDEAGRYDVVTCLELLEHVPSPASVIAACAALLKPGGQVFFSTINRNLIAWLTAIIGAEYILNLIPRGTHQYPKLIRPAELGTHARAAGLQVREIAGLIYIPFLRSCRIGGRPDVNYLMHGSKPQ